MMGVDPIESYQEQKRMLEMYKRKTVVANKPPTPKQLKPVLKTEVITIKKEEVKKTLSKQEIALEEK